MKKGDYHLFFIKLEKVIFLSNACKCLDCLLHAFDRTWSGYAVDRVFY